jgi:hypothetical protein
MFRVNFSDNQTFKFTECQLLRIPYFKTLIESYFKLDLDINHASTGFEFLHSFATLDEIDITDPLDKYPFVLKQCDFFCYDKLKELVERKYSFRADMVEAKDILDKPKKIGLSYVGGFSLKVIWEETFDQVDHGRLSHIELTPFIEPPIFSSDPEINEIHKYRYITQMQKLYETTIFNEIFENYTIETLPVEIQGKHYSKYKIKKQCDTLTFIDRQLYAVEPLEDIIIFCIRKDRFIELALIADGKFNSSFGGLNTYKKLIYKIYK